MKKDEKETPVRCVACGEPAVVFSCVSDDEFRPYCSAHAPKPPAK